MGGALDGLKRFVTDHMLQLAGILSGHLRRYAKLGQILRQQRVALVDHFGHLAARLQQRDEAILVHLDITAAFQKAHGTADAGLGIAHVLAHVDGADVRRLAGQHQNGLQIHLAGFLQMHVITPSFYYSKV